MGRPHRARSKHVRAVFAQRCAACGGEIRAGMAIVNWAGSWQHARCGRRVKKRDTRPTCTVCHRPIERGSEIAREPTYGHAECVRGKTFI